MSKKNQKFTGWNQRVKDAKRDPIELEIGESTVLVHQPTGKSVRDMGKVGEDIDEIVRILFGEDQAEVVLDAYDDAPFNVLPDLVSDLLEEFGLGGLGNPQVVPN